MSISLDFPTASQRAKMKQEGDFVSLYVSVFAMGSFIASVLFAAAFGINSVWKWVPSAIWMPAAAGVAFGLAVIGIVVSSLTRGRFIYQEGIKHEAIISEKAGKIKAAFKNWIVEKYASTNLRAARDRYLAHDADGNIHDIKPGDIYEASRPLEIRFDDLEEIYPRGGADQRIDEEVRRRVFDGLEYSDGVLRAEKKYESYAVISARIRPNILEKYIVKHWGINLKDL